MFTTVAEAAIPFLADLNIFKKLKITRYQIGRFPDIPPPLDRVDFDPKGNKITAAKLATFENKFASTIADMRYIELNDKLCELKMFVPQVHPYFDVNAVVIYAKVGNDEFPFLVSYSKGDNPKFSTVTNKFGTQYYYMLQLNILERADKYDFSNIPVEATDFAMIEHDYDLHAPFSQEYDQAIVRYHQTIQDDHAVFIVNSESQYFGIIMQPWDYQDYFQVLSIAGQPLQIDGEDLVISLKNTDIILNN